MGAPSPEALWRTAQRKAAAERRHAGSRTDFRHQFLHGIAFIAPCLAAKALFVDPVDGPRGGDDLDALADVQPVAGAREHGGLRLRAELGAHAAAPCRRVVRVARERRRFPGMAGAVLVVDGWASEQVGLAYLAADFGVSIEPREDHASYLASWLAVLKGDKRAIFTAASMGPCGIRSEVVVARFVAN